MNIENIQQFAETLAAVIVDIKWVSNLVFSVGNKMFLIIDLDHVPTGASFKVPDSEFDHISRQKGFKPAPYLARYKWVYINDITLLGKEEWQHFIQQSYQLVRDKLPVKVRRELGLT